jgi:hypothetical protein
MSPLPAKFHIDLNQACSHPYTVPSPTKADSEAAQPPRRRASGTDHFSLVAIDLSQWRGRYSFRMRRCRNNLIGTLGRQSGCYRRVAAVIRPIPKSPRGFGASHFRSRTINPILTLAVHVRYYAALTPGGVVGRAISAAGSMGSTARWALADVIPGGLPMRRGKVVGGKVDAVTGQRPNRPPAPT